MISRDLLSLAQSADVENLPWRRSSLSAYTCVECGLIGQTRAQWRQWCDGCRATRSKRRREVRASVAQECSVDECVLPALATDLCQRHYARRRAYGTTELPTRPSKCCAECGTAFVPGRVGAMYCQRRCRDLAKRLPCANCRKPIHGGHGSLPVGQRTCRDCRKERRGGTGACARCAAAIPARQKFCSRACVKVSDQRTRARMDRDR